MQSIPAELLGSSPAPAVTLQFLSRALPWFYPSRKCYDSQRTKPHQINLIRAGIMARNSRYQWKSLRGQEWVTLSRSVVDPRLCCQGWELIKHLPPSWVPFWVGCCFCGFFGMRLQNTFLLGHISSAKHILSIPWSGSQDSTKAVNCDNCHKGRAGAAAESFVGDAHPMDHSLLDSSSWSHQTSNHLRVCAPAKASQNPSC